MKKGLVVLILALVGFVYASDIEREIMELVEEVKKAPPEERYKVMNRLKLKLRELGRMEREKAINRVYRELKGKKYEKEHREEKYRYEERYKEKHRYKEEEHEKYEEKYEEKFEEKYEEKSEKYEEEGERGRHDD